MDFSLRVGLRILRLHWWIYERSGGRVGHRMLGTPCLLLRTTGRRTGLPRTSALTYARDGESYLVVASMGGADQAPAWLHNLRAAPEAEAQVARTRFPVTARVVEPADPGFDRLWQLVNDNNNGRYRRYQQKTSRPIPVVVLSKQRL